MKILLFSRGRASCEVDGKNVDLSFSNPVQVQENQIVKVFPLEENALPMCFFAGQQNKYIKNIKFKDYILSEIVSFPQVFQGRFFGFKNFKGGSFGVVGAPFCFNVFVKHQSFCFDLPNDISGIDLKDTPNALFVQGFCGQNGFLGAFHKSSKEFLTFVGNIEVSDASIKAVVTKNTLAGHGQIQEFAITQNSFEKISEEPVYLHRKPKTVPPFLTHIAFFEAVREKDFFLAKTYLSDDLAKKLSSQHLQEFFGDFDAIKVLNVSGQTQIALCKNKSSNFAIASVFSLSISQNKIADINLVD